MTRAAPTEDDSDTESAKPDFPSSQADQLKLRLDKDQMRHIRKLADDQHTTLNAAARWLLDRGIEGAKLRNINDISDDIALNWARFGERLLALNLEKDLLEALVARRFEEARALAVALLKQQAAEARRRADKLS
jgi:hypothetical protein